MREFSNSNRSKAGLITALAAIVLALAAFVPELAAQGQNYYNPKDDQYRLLGLRRAKQAYDYALTEYERKKELRAKDLISELELEQVRNRFTDAEVNYHQALLAVMFEKQYVAITGAMKLQAKNGQKVVRLTLENTSGGGEEFQKLVDIQDDLFHALKPDIIHDVYVSLLNDGGAIISQPYEAKIEELHYGKPASVQFALLQDVDAVTVNLIYGNGTQSGRKIFLQKDASANKVLVQSEQFSQEVELGASATFDLSLELFSGENNTFKLEVVNLPRQINRYFSDPGSNARLSFFKFTESTNTRRASLQIFMPDRTGEGVVIDSSLAFYVLVIPREQAAELGDVRLKQWGEDEIAGLNIGYARLELVPRGVGKLLVRAPQLFYSVRATQAVNVPIDLVNDGTRRLQNVQISIDPPLNWGKAVEPANVPVLEVAGERRAMITLTPPENVSVGRYEIRVRTTSLADDRPIAGEDKTITVEIQGKANVLGTAVLVLLIVGLVAGIVIFGVKLSKR